MLKRTAWVTMAVLFVAISGSLLFSSQRLPWVQAGQVDENICFGCHSEIKALKTENKHQKLNCTECHGATVDHASDPQRRPSTSFDLANCSRCHADQFNSFMTVNYKAKPKIEKAAPVSRAPTLDLLLMPHGFTKEHAEPRSHAFMLIDHLLVDRAYGGQFQLKNWTDIGKPSKAWDVLTDTGKTLPETAKAANPNCLLCKTSDMILDWAYLGNKNAKAKWDRTSNVFEMAKAMQNPVGCVQCHDPHATKHRIVRDALIEAVSKFGATPYGASAQKDALDVREFRGYRRIALLTRPNPTLQCAQCHVEYACNPGFDPTTGAAIRMDDPRTNVMPWKNVWDLQKFYDETKFRDFKHAVTGAPLIKMQHPEAETFWGSKHEKLGLTCASCHMPKVKNSQGKTYTSHWATSPRNYVKDTCGSCHGWTAEEAEYRIDAVQNYVKGKMRKAEFWLGRLIETFETAQRLGVSEEKLNEARKSHSTAHLLWEWWTAENSDGFHNPDQARESLAQSISAAKQGIEILEKAIKEKSGK
jgi:formate-dependent nitrite reductase cytochrome c552 subunit